MDIFSLSQYFFFYIPIICDFLPKNKLFLLLRITLYKNLCKNVILSEHILFFFINYSAVVTMFYWEFKKEKNVNLGIFADFNFLK